MRYGTDNDHQRMLPGPDGSEYWSLTDWYRAAAGALTDYAEAAERMIASGTRPTGRDYFALTSLSRQIVAVRDDRDLPRSTT